MPCSVVRVPLCSAASDPANKVQVENAGRARGADPRAPLVAGSLQTITDKLQLLLTMMNSPRPGSAGDADAPAFTPLQRLQLLREVTEEARVFRLGGEDKIRVATGTCETVRPDFL